MNWREGQKILKVRRWVDNQLSYNITLFICFIISKFFPLWLWLANWKLYISNFRNTRTLVILVGNSFLILLYFLRPFYPLHTYSFSLCLCFYFLSLLFLCLCWSSVIPKMMMNIYLQDCCRMKRKPLCIVLKTISVK